MVHIYYDFPPHDSDCPLLLNPPHNMKINAKAVVVAPERGRPHSSSMPSTLSKPTRAGYVADRDRSQSTPLTSRNTHRVDSYLDRGRIASALPNSAAPRHAP